MQHATESKPPKGEHTHTRAETQKFIHTECFD